MNIEVPKTKSEIFLITIIILIMMNFINSPKLIIAQLFALIYMIIIYYKYKDNFMKLIVYSTIVFAIINASIFVQIGTHKIYLYYLTLLIYLLYSVFQIFKNKRALFSVKNKYVVFIFIMGAYFIFSIFISDNKYVAINSMKSYVLMISLLIMTIRENRNIEDIKETLKFCELILIGILFLSIVEILGFKYGINNVFSASGLLPEVYPHIKRIPIVFFYNPNNYSLVLTIVIIILLIKSVYAKNIRKNIYYTLLYVICQIVLIFAMCRTAWISLILAIIFGLFFFLINKAKEEFIKFSSLGILTMIIFVSLAYVPQMQPYYGKVEKIPGIQYFDTEIDDSEVKLEIGKSGSTNLRYTLIYDVLEGVFVEKNYLGFGPGNTSLYIKEKDNTFGKYNAHSFWLEILGDYGVFIFIYSIYIYLCICFGVLEKFKTYIEINKQYAVMFGISAFALVFLSFAPSTVMNFPSFWIILGLITSLSME